MYETLSIIRMKLKAYHAWSIICKYLTYDPLSTLASTRTICVTTLSVFQLLTLLYTFLDKRLSLVLWERVHQEGPIAFVYFKCISSVRKYQQFWKAPIYMYIQWDLRSGLLWSRLPPKRDSKKQESRSQVWLNVQKPCMQKKLLVALVSMES